MPRRLTAPRRSAAARLFVAIGVVLAFGSAARVKAAINFYASGGVGSFSGGSSEVNDSYDNTGESSAAGSAGHTEDNGALNFHGEARSSIGQGGVHADSFVNITKYGGLGNTTLTDYHASGSASGTWTDFKITGPGSGNVTTQLRIHLGGVLSGTTPNTPGNNWTANAGVQIAISVNNNTVGSGFSNYISKDGTPVTTPGNGLLATFDGDEVLTTASFTVPLNTAFSVRLFLLSNASTTVQANETGITGATSNFSNTLSFALDQPVFSLPAGYTANSSSANVVNNSYSVAPEPISLSLVTLGSAVIRRRRLR